MKKNLDYPVKYAIMELKINDEILGYIPSKCYVVNTNTQGKGKATYEVIFPYNDIESYMEAVKKHELTSLVMEFSENYTDTTNITEIYDDYATVDMLVKQKNHSLKMQQVSAIPFSSTEWRRNCEKVIDNYNNNQTIIKSYAKNIEYRTRSMSIQYPNQKVKTKKLG